MIESTNLQIAIPFVQIESFNPNIGDFNFKKSQEIYFMNICTCFISIRKHNPVIKLRLFTNKEIPSKFGEILKKNRVEITICPFTFNPPTEYGELFRGCFYIFDAISNIEESTLFLDPDIICIKKIDLLEVQQHSLRNEIGVFYPGFSNDKKINGLTHNEAIEIYNSLMETAYVPKQHLGGECFYLPISLRDSLMLDFRKFWLRANQETNIQKHCFLTTEEHILSALTLTLPSFSLKNHVARIWTTKTYRKVEGIQEIEKLTFWHLPSEKSQGLLAVFNFFSTHKNEYESYSEPEEIEYLKKALKLNFLRIRNLISQVLSKLKILADWFMKSGT